ncbi:magnesium transporter MgtE N-terminal domain-containing protein, partial [Planktomarina temperata]
MTDLYETSVEPSDVLDAQRVSDVRGAVEHEDAQRLHTLLDPLHPADIADLLEQVSDSVRAGILRLWKDGIDGDVLSELDDSIREDIIDGLDAAELAVAVRDLDSDDVVDLLEDLDEPQQEAILGALDDAERVVVEQSLSFPEESAGRLMQREVVMAPEHWNVGQAIDYLRRQEDLPEQFYHMILIDPRLR